MPLYLFLLPSQALLIRSKSPAPLVNMGAGGWLAVSSHYGKASGGHRPAECDSSSPLANGAHGEMGRRTEEVTAGQWPHLTWHWGCAGTLGRLQSVIRLTLKVIRRFLKDQVLVNCMEKQVWWGPSLFLCSEPGLRADWTVGKARFYILSFFPQATAHAF